jgi:two-component system, OmpR family, sensor histidine kinase MtrB
MRAPSWLPEPARRVLRPARRMWRTGVRRLRRLVVAVRRAWRRSLQVRVVTITLISSSLLVGAFGLFVATRSADILLSRATDDVEARLKSKVQYATLQLTVHRQVFDAKLPNTMNDTVVSLSEGDPGQSGGAVVTLRSAQYDNLKPVTLPNVDTSEVITRDLVATVAGKGQRAWQIRTADLGEGRHKYLVFGSPVPTRFGQLELYYLVPLTTEDRAANEIRTTVLVTGLVLVMLLGVLAALVTRLVVTPVRDAARTAQRLSAGLLDQRMMVDGEDDLARLAASFNQMAENLQRQIVRLEEMSRLQRRFTSDVSHELRTPLTTVRMAADLIFAEREEFEPAVSRSAELLQAELDRFEDLLTDLLEISRFDAGFAILDAEPTDLLPVVRRVVERLAGLAERAGIAVDVRLPAEPVIAEVDPRRVERVLRNLVGNAVEHGEGRPVIVALACDDRAVAITVRDHGVGLRPGEEKLVFNRFWRADPSRARQTGGTGLGLSISVEDARLHGGWLEAWGSPGKGAVFRLTVPLRAGDRLASSPLPLVPGTEPGPGEQERAPDEPAEVVR